MSDKSTSAVRRSSGSAYRIECSVLHISVTNPLDVQPVQVVSFDNRLP